MRLWRRLTRAWRKRPRLRGGSRGQRSLALGSHVGRLGRIADKESICIEQLEEALGLLTDDCHSTRAEVLDIVEDLGLEGAVEALSGAR